MSNRRITEQEVFRFIYEKIDTVPHLEALLQLWSTRPRQWPAAVLGHLLFVNDGTVQQIMDDLARLQLVTVSNTNGRSLYSYLPDNAETDALVQALADTYKKQLVRVTRLIHGKSTSGARGFGDAFRFKQKGD